MFSILITKFMTQIRLLLDKETTDSRFREEWKERERAREREWRGMKD
jgi:hypothetical protein